ncbi:hypothetical protein EZ456_04965 [Pedobacter psychrodurus]|uniref:Uncharacterized protein n=1 Tax=Pedobacter psychrodurus TaxID=2530456 RepID=A0A4R0Q783_9SPHI|nr:hypothetical protein [Pedobacter psychrodurus]TCD28735.1 hypothetical protein EZ456_04965 [Pedobacter psychrodurus]
MISTKELSFLFQSAVKAGSEKCFRDGRLLKQQLSFSEAYAIYGRTNVDRWITEKLIVTSNSAAGIFRKSISRTQLEAVAFKSNRISYLPVAER